MPLYTYFCNECEKNTEMNIQIALRDDIHLCQCGTELKRKIDRPGAVYAPTSKKGLAT